MPPQGAPEILRERVEAGRAAVLGRLIEAVRPALRSESETLDAELTARILSALADEYARLILADPERFPAERLLDHARWRSSNREGPTRSNYEGAKTMVTTDEALKAGTDDGAAIAELEEIVARRARRSSPDPNRLRRDGPGRRLRHPRLPRGSVTRSSSPCRVADRTQADHLAACAHGPPRIVIVGGGFAGYYAARDVVPQAAGRGRGRDPQSTDYFLYLPLLPEVAGGRPRSPPGDRLDPGHVAPGGWCSARRGRDMTAPGGLRRRGGATS